MDTLQNTFFFSNISSLLSFSTNSVSLSTILMFNFLKGARNIKTLGMNSLKTSYFYRYQKCSHHSQVTVHVLLGLFRQGFFRLCSTEKYKELHDSLGYFYLRHKCNTILRTYLWFVQAPLHTLQSGVHGRFSRRHLHLRVPQLELQPHLSRALHSAQIADSSVDTGVD